MKVLSRHAKMPAKHVPHTLHSCKNVRHPLRRHDERERKYAIVFRLNTRSVGLVIEKRIRFSDVSCHLQLSQHRHIYKKP